MRQLMGINGEKFLFLEHELFAKCSELMRQCGTVTCPCVGIHAECAFGAAARAAIFAGVQPSRLTLRGLPLSEGVAPGYSQYSLPGWIVLLALFSP